MEGHGIFQVERVGDATENGKVFVAAQIDNHVKTPLTEQLDRLGRLITVASYVISALILIGRMAMYFLNFDFTWISFIQYFLATIMICVTLIVVAVPEGLKPIILYARCTHVKQWGLLLLFAQIRQEH